jgi:hypothetical protein
MMSSIILDPLPEELTVQAIRAKRARKLLQDREETNDNVLLGKSNRRNDPEFDQICASAVYRNLTKCLNRGDLPCRVDYECTEHNNVSAEVAYIMRQAGYIVSTGLRDKRRDIIVDDIHRK